MKIRRLNFGRRTKVISGALLLACTVGVAPFALAAPIPGATYNGRGADGATVTLTLSPDGTLITSYNITGVIGDTCSLVAGGAPPSFPGVPITNGSFKYKFAQYITFKGSFHGAQSASGTFYIHQDATKQAKACSSGTINWTASTTSKPASGGGNAGGNPGGGTAGGGNPGGGNPGGKTTVVTRVSFHKLSSKRVGGRIRTANGACLSRRVVILWRGTHKLASTRTGKHGTFSFPRSGKVRGHAVRASVMASTLSNAICTAASSTFVRV